MECDICRVNAASFHLTEIIDGKVRKLHICGACAEKNGVNLQDPNSIPEILLELNNQAVQADVDREKSCPTCHMRWSDYRKTSRLGCPDCYEAFADDLTPLLKNIQKGIVHKGKISGAQNSILAPAAVPDAADLKRQLDAAVKAESFEEAARLRDAIRHLDGPANEHGQ